MHHDGSGRHRPEYKGLRVLKILVTGAHGFAGRHLCKRFLESGAEVVPLACQLADREQLEAETLATEFNYVIHLAAISNPAHGIVDEIYRTNLMGTINLLEVLRKSKSLEKVLLVSSGNIYGNAEHIPTVETTRPQPTNHYAISKVAMEHLVSLYSDVPVVVARPFNFTGPSQADNFIVPKLVKHFKAACPTIEIGDPTIIREVNHVLFVCEAFNALLRYGVAGETYNVCTGVGFSISEIILQLSSLTGHSPCIKTNMEFIRTNDIKQLIGDNRKIISLCLQHNHHLPFYSLTDILSEMLNYRGDL
jgi:nucleoside-diphosphate-sugar epimerase